MNESDKKSVSNANLNRLRAAVLGANDGIVSVSSIILGVAGATSTKHTILIAGLAGLVAGAFSMAVGEYVSVSSQRDTERAFIAREKRRLRAEPERELESLAWVYEDKGLSRKTAQLVARELSANDPIAAHLDAKLNLDESDLNNPAQAALASLIAFTIGGLIPLISVMVAASNSRAPVVFIAVIVALTATGYVSATAGTASRKLAIIRIVIGGALAMAATYTIGHFLGAIVH